MQSPPRIKISRKKVTFPAALFYAAQQRRSCRSVLRGPAFCVRQDAQALRRRTVKGDCRTCRFLAGHPKPEERPVPLGNAGFFQTLSKKKCARFQLPSYEIAVTIAHVRQRVKGFQEKGPVRGGLAGRARPGWPLIKKRTAGPTPTCMGPAVLYRRIRRRVQNPVYSPNNEACLINRHAMPLAGTQCLSRLQRTHGVFRAYGVPYGSKPQLVCFVLHVGSPTKALTQSSRHNASLDARCLFAPTAFPKKAFSQSSLHNV